MTISRRRFCLILSSPSGAGKTTLAKQLVKSDPNLYLSISATTRPPRANEHHGADYYFLSRDEFLAMRDAENFFEWAEVFGNFYGTPKEPIRRAFDQGRDVVFDIDWQGAQSVKQALPHDTVGVFILPPSREELVRRIYGRASDPASVIEARLKAANEELTHWGEYAYVLVNKNIEDSVAALKAILAAERSAAHRQTGLPDFVEGLKGPAKS